MNKKSVELGLIIDYGSLVFISKHGYRDWHEMFKKYGLDKKYKNKENYEMFCYMKYMYMDATQMFLEKIKELEKNEK